MLSVVLLGLAAASAGLPLLVSQVREQIDSTVKGVVKSKPKPWTPLDLTTNQAIISRIEGPFKIHLSGDHNLFNPVRWIRKSDGRVVKVATGREIGPGALVVAKIEPLDLTVTFDGVSTNGDKLQYTLSVVHETTTNARKESGSAGVNVQNALFRILNVSGPAESPNALTVVLKGDKDTITVVKDKPYTRVIGYMADLFYAPEKQDFKHRKVGDTLRLTGESEPYKIVAITQNEVVLSAEQTGKRTIVRLNTSSS